MLLRMWNLVKNRSEFILNSTFQQPPRPAPLPWGVVSDVTKLRKLAHHLSHTRAAQPMSARVSWMESLMEEEMRFIGHSHSSHTHTHAEPEKTVWAQKGTFTGDALTEPRNFNSILLLHYWNSSRCFLIQLQGEYTHFKTLEVNKSCFWCS